MSKLATACPKPRRKKKSPALPGGSLKRQEPMRRSGRLAKVGKPKREAKNREYYAGAEWRAKRKLVFERDGYQCVETWNFDDPSRPFGVMRCPNRGEVVNGKQTARGLVCEEVSYGHRGVEDYIDTCKTRCKDCDRRCTPLERINHSRGLNRRG